MGSLHQLLVLSGFVILVVANGTTPAAACSLEYFDCNEVTDIQTYNIENICSTSTKPNTTIQEFTILQHQDIQEAVGFSCKVTRSTLTEYCGAYSHNKLAKAPEIEIHEALTIEQCHDLVNTESFNTQEGKVEIKIGYENIITSYDLGIINIDNNRVSCRGQSARFHDKIVDDILQVSQYKVIVQKEKFIIDHEKNQVEVAADHTMLPSSCNTETQGCQIADRTFVWQIPESRCSLEQVRTIPMREENGYLVDEVHKILLRKGALIPSPRGCPATSIFATEYPNIYLSDTQDWPSMGIDLDMAEYIRARDDYVTYFLEKKISQEDSNIQSQVCRNSVKLNQDEIVPLPKEGVFMKRNGDTVEKFKCAKKTSNIVVRKTCHEDIPITGGFVKVTNRVFTSHSAPKPCNKYFGLKIKTLEDLWVEINPHITVISTPEDLPTSTLEFDHEDLSDGGIYTNQELDAWKKHLELSDYHEAISKSISFGVCTHRGDCENEGGVPAYNLDNLYPKGIESQYNPFSQASEWIKTWGTYISIIVIMMETFHFCVWSVAIVYTVLYDGIIGLKAFAFMMCCKPMATSATVNRRHRRLNNRKRTAKETLLETIHEEGMPSGKSDSIEALSLKAIDANDV